MIISALVMIIAIISASLVLWMYYKRWPLKSVVKIWSQFSGLSVFTLILGFYYSIEQTIRWPNVLVALIFGLIMFGLTRLSMPIILRGVLPYRKDV